MKLFNLSKIVLILFCAIASSALAKNIVPTASSSSIGVSSVKQWSGVNELVKKLDKDVYIKVGKDIDFGNEQLETIDLERKNLYLIGEGSVVLSRLNQKKPLFKNAGDTVVLQNIIFDGVNYSLDGNEKNTGEYVYGVLFNTLSANNLFVQNLKINNVYVDLEEFGINSFGFLSGNADYNINIDGLKVENFNVKSFKVMNIGSLIGSVSGFVSLENVNVSGEINITNKGINTSGEGISVGGVLGSVFGNIIFDSVISSMEITNKIDESADSKNQKIMYVKSGIGGLVGKIGDVGSVLDSVRVFNSNFSGLISSSSINSFNGCVGGIIGLVHNAHDVLLNDIEVSGSESLLHNGPNAYMGGVVGAVLNVDSIRAFNTNVKKNISVSNTNTKDDGAIGGFLGASYNSDVFIKDGDCSSVLKNEYSNKEQSDIGMNVGGIIGAFWGDGLNDSLTLENIDAKNKILIQYLSIFKVISIGGLVGYVTDFANVSILNTTVQPRLVQGLAEDLISIDFSSADFQTFYVGGMIGIVGPGGGNVGIASSFVQGDMNFNVGSNRGEGSYIAGFIGHNQTGGSVSVNEFFYDGNIIFQSNSSNDKINKAGILTFGVTPKTLSLNNGYVLCNQVDSFTDSDESISSSNAFLNEKYRVDFTPSMVYSINDSRNVWYYDNKRAKLVSFCENIDECKVPQKITFINLKGDGFDSEIYSNNKGEWNLKKDGSLSNIKDFPSYQGVSFNSNGDTIKVWKNGNDEIYDSELIFEDDDIFVETRTKMPKIVLLLDSVRSTSAAFQKIPSKKIELVDNADFNVAKDDVMPTYVFEDGDSNGVVKYSKNNMWSVLNEDYLIENVASLKRYIANNKSKEKITLVAEIDSRGTFAQPFRKFILLDNPEATFRIKSLGVNDTLTIKGNGRYFPKMTELEFLRSSNGSNCLQLFVNGSLLDTLKMNSVMDMTVYKDSDVIRFFGSSCPDTIIDTTSNTPSTPNTTDNDSLIVKDSIKRTIACIESSKISNVEFIKSGKSAAKFSFKFNIPDSCNMLNPSASINGPKGLLWYSPFSAKTKSYSFTNYPLEPGTYKFSIKLAEGKDTTFSKTFKADISINGHKWSMAALGSWPKNVLKDGEALVYKWNPECVMGDYWQYEAIPHMKDVVENEGYWIYAEKNLNFSLDLPLKVAESDSISWKLKKNTNGWNLLANPYSWDLEATSIKNFMDPESDEAPFWRYNESTDAFEVASVLGANEAFWISTDKERTIKVSTKPVFISKVSTSKTLKKSSFESWSMSLIASSEKGTVDSWNVFGVGSKDISLEEPPAGMSNFVEASFVGEGGAMLAKRILAKSDENEYTWNLNIKTNELGKVKLSLEGMEQVRAMGYRAILVVGNNLLEFGADASVSVDVSSNSTKALLKVEPSDTKVFVSAGISNLRYMVNAFNMNVQFNIPFEMAGHSVYAYLMDVNGKVISKAYSKARAGSNAVVISTPVRNGVYVLQVRVGHESRSIRLAL